MPTADEQPQPRANARTWLWASLTAILFLGAGIATIAWASERPSDTPTLIPDVTSTGQKSPTRTSGDGSSTPAVSPASPTTTTPAVGDVDAIAVVGDSLSVQSTNEQKALLQQAGWRSVKIDAQLFRRIPSDSSTKPPYSGIAAVRDIRKHGADPNTWIIELGTNDVGTTGNNSLSMIKVINAMLDEIGPGHRIVWINIYHGQQPQRTATFNRVLAEAAAARADVRIADWAAVAKTSGYLIEDHVHLTVKGAKAFAGLIVTAAEETAS